MQLQITTRVLAIQELILGATILGITSSPVFLQSLKCIQDIIWGMRNSHAHFL